jgi:hypothetical protein
MGAPVLSMLFMVAVVMMVVSPGPPIAPVVGVAPIGGLSIHHLWLYHDRWLFDDHGRGLDIDGRRRVDARRLRGDNHRGRGDENRHWQPEPHGDMDPTRVGGARECQGRKAAETHDAKRP